MVETNAPDRDTAFAAPDATSQAIAGHILEFLGHEVRAAQLPPELLPIQSGVGNVANAVMAGLDDRSFRAADRLHRGVAGRHAEPDSLRPDECSPPPPRCRSVPTRQTSSTANIDSLKNKIVLRTQEISNHPEVIRRLGVIAMNGLIEADIYGNVNSTHIRGTTIMNGIGGSGDFARNAYLSIFMTPSTAKGGSISSHRADGDPCRSHRARRADHRDGARPRRPARPVAETARRNHHRQRGASVVPAGAQDYFDRACRLSPGKHTPHLLDEAFRLIKSS